MADPFSRLRLFPPERAIWNRCLLIFVGTNSAIMTAKRLGGPWFVSPQGEHNAIHGALPLFFSDRFSQRIWSILLVSERKNVLDGIFA